MADPDTGGGGGGGGRPGHPDPEMVGGGGLKIFFHPFEPQFGLKIRGEPGPRAPPLDPPQFKASRTFFEVGFFFYLFPSARAVVTRLMLLLVDPLDG